MERKMTAQLEFGSNQITNRSESDRRGLLFHLKIYGLLNDIVSSSVYKESNTGMIN